MSKATPTQCPDDDSIGALVAGTLSAEEREAIAIHAASCESCHEMLDRLTAISGDDGGETLVLRAGTSVGRFTIAERLGVGGMGVVYAASDDELERRVALKLLRPERAGADARARLVREAKTLARLSHPNIVTVFDVGEHRGNVYVVMELVDGGSIAAWCARQPRAATEIVDAMLDAGRGLAAAHAAGFIHRDIKPDNILVGRDGRVRVTDFGLARLGEADVIGDREFTGSATHLTKTGTLLGTPAYMAPEALRGETSEQADQWAFCATLYELLGGVRPFPSDPAVRRSAIETGKLEPPVRRIAPRTLDVIARGLRADPAARWPDMTAVLAALRRRRTRVPIALGATAIVGAALTYAAWPAPDPEIPYAPPVIVDRREGCSCPYSACTTKCVSVCNARAFSIGPPVPGINVIGRQEAVAGVSLDGNSILYLSGRRCELDRIFLGRQRDGMYVPIDLTEQLAPGVGLYEGCCSLSGDGKRLLLTADRRRFVEAPVDGTRVLPAVPLFDPELPDPRLKVRYPTLSADRTTLYYRIVDLDERGEPGPHDGLYVAERERADAPFGKGHRITGSARRFDYVTGESSDGLTLFMTYEFGTRILTRTTKHESYTYPAPWQSYEMLGFRAVPTGDCRRVAITSSPGGCEGEEIRFLYAED